MNRRVEKLASEFHAIYMREIARQGRIVSHPERYDDLTESIKDLDRALARYVLANFERRKYRHNRSISMPRATIDRHR